MLSIELVAPPFVHGKSLLFAPLLDSVPSDMRVSGSKEELVAGAVDSSRLAPLCSTSNLENAERLGGAVGGTSAASIVENIG